MTVSTLNNRVSYAGNGVTTVFSFPNRFLLDADLVVIDVLDSTGAETTKTLTTHYTVTGAGGASGGSVTMLTAPATGHTLVIYRDPALTQPIDLVNGDDLDVDTGIERGLDRNTLQIQRLRDLVDRSMRLSDGDTSGATVQLPIPAANRLLGWNSGATAIENKVPADSALTTVTEFAATLLDDATAAAARTTLGAVSTTELTNFITDQDALTAPAVGDTLVVYDLDATANKEIALSDMLKVVNGLTEDTAPDKTADFVLSYDDSASAAKKIKLATLIRHEAVRQTAVAGGVDSTTGQANFLSAGTGLAVSRAATTTPVIVTVAAGEDDLGPVNYRKKFSADQADYWASLAPWNVTYLFDDRDTATGAWATYQTLVPPQYGAFFDKTKHSLLAFSGADASTTITDTYGNAFTAGGNAQIDTAITIDSQQTLLLDGTTDYVECTAVPKLPDAWTFEGKINNAVLPTDTNGVTLVSATNAGGFGLFVRLYNAAGTYQLEINASSNGSSLDIASAVRVSIATPVTGTAYHWAVTWDKVSGKLYTYWDGIKANDTTMATNICGVLTKLRYGAKSDGLSAVNGSMAGIRMSPCCRYPAGTTFTPPTLPFTADAEWFDISSFTWKYGSPTEWTTKQRVCIGEVTTNATVPTSTITYALRGSYRSIPQNITFGAVMSVNHYIGGPPQSASVEVVNRTAEHGFVPGNTVLDVMTTDGAAAPSAGLKVTNTTLSLALSVSGVQITNQSSYGRATLTAANWQMIFTGRRGW